MFDAVKQLCQQGGIGGRLGVPVPEGGNGKWPPVPVKTGAGGWPAIADDDEGASEMAAEDVDGDEDE